MKFDLDWPSGCLKSVDDDDGRTMEPAYTISSPNEPKGSLAQVN